MRRYTDVIMFWVPSECDKQAPVQDQNSPFFTTPRFDGHPSVLVRASRISELTLQELTAFRAPPSAAASRSPRALDLLAPQELQIARLAAEGLSNRHIGQLYRDLPQAWRASPCGDEGLPGAAAEQHVSRPGHGRGHLATHHLVVVPLAPSRRRDRVRSRRAADFLALASR